MSDDCKLTPLMVVARALGSELAAADVLERLGEFAALGIEPGEVGVIVFPREGEAFFEVAEDPQLHASGNGEAVYPPMTVEDIEEKGAA